MCEDRDECVLPEVCCWCLCRRQGIELVAFFCHQLPDSSELLFKWTVTFMYLELSRAGFFSFLSNIKIYSLCPVLDVKSLFLYFQCKMLICVVECVFCAFSCSCCCMMAACLFLEGEHNSSRHPQLVKSVMVKA